MKKLRVCVLLALVMACLMAASASAARSLQKGDVTLRLPSGAADLIRITPTPAPARDPATICKALGHDYKQTSKKNATCSKDGSITYTCSVCGKTKTETIDATGDHNYERSGTVKATCTEIGYYTLKCSTCGDTRKEVFSQSLGHDFGAWKEVSRTKLERKCSRCGKTETKVNSDAKLPAASEKTTPTPRPYKGHEESKVTPTPRPYKGHEESKVTPTPKPQIVGKVTATPKAEGKTEAKATATPKKKTSSSSKKTTSYESYDYTAQDGMIEVYTTAGKVNLRTGPGKKNGISNQVPKKNTSLGSMIEAEVDSTGNVWYRVRYKNKSGWITSDYARAVIGDVTNSDDRHVGIDSVDLSDVCFSYISEAADHYGLDLDMGGEASNNEVSISGSGEFIECIEIFGKGYALYGIEVGDKLKSVENAMKKNGLYCASKSGGTYIYKRPCQPYSMSVNDEGFDSYVEVVLDESKCVESISWNAYTE